MNNITLSIYQFFRYVYGGLVIVLALVIGQEESLGYYSAVLGTTGIIAIFAAVGLFMYAMTRTIVVMAIAGPLHFLLHHLLWSRILDGWPTDGSCVWTEIQKERPKRLAKLGSLANEFRFHRDNLWSEDVRSHFAQRQSECYILYLTASSLSALWVLSFFDIIAFEKPIDDFLIWVSVVCFLLAFFEGLSICSCESITFQRLKRRDLPSRSLRSGRLY